MDLRYNMIKWVHRSTRGWSYGIGIIDPHTGEILKGHVSLGSLRVRQDFHRAGAGRGLRRRRDTRPAFARPLARPPPATGRARSWPHPWIAAEQAHNTWLLAKIDQFRRDPKALDIPAPPRLPDGSPIGAEEWPAP
ncbi:MAG: hypothetical protein ABIU29_09740 [Chthoniobacterales bacterium]